MENFKLKTCFCGEIHRQPKKDEDVTFQSKCRNCGKFFREPWHCYPFCSRECSKEFYPHGYLLREATIYPGFQKDYVEKERKLSGRFCQSCGGRLNVFGISATKETWRGSFIHESCFEIELKKNCKACKKKFVSKKRDAEYCSETCFRRLWMRTDRNKKKEIRKFICKACGIEFIGFRKYHAVCSRKCRYKLNNHPELR